MVTFFQKSVFNQNFSVLEKIFLTFFIFWVFFGVFNIGTRSKMAIFGKKPCTTTFTHFFFEPLNVDFLDARAHFLCFLKKVSFMGGDQKKVFFLTFFFFFKKSKNLQFSPHEIHFLVVFWTKKNDTFNNIRAKEISK